MIRVSLQDFFRSGNFGPVTLGMSSAQVEAALGPPDFPTDRTFRGRRTPSVWGYGNIEFHFGIPWGLDELHLIWYETNFGAPERPWGGRSIDLDPWIIRDGVSRDEVKRGLDDVGITYQQVYRPRYDGVYIITMGGVILSFFEGSDEPERAGLYAIELNKDNKPYHIVPTNYEPIGTVEHFWGRVGVVGIRLNRRVLLERGERIAFDLGRGFEEQQVNSLEVNNRSVERADGWLLVGIKTHLTKDQARKGVRVYRVNALNWELHAQVTRDE